MPNKSNKIVEEEKRNTPGSPRTLCDVNEIEDTSDKQSHESVEWECVNLMLVSAFRLTQFAGWKSGTIAK